MAKLIKTVIDPIQLTENIHGKISALIKLEFNKEPLDLTRINTLREANDIVIDTLTEMVEKAKEEIQK